MRCDLSYNECTVREWGKRFKDEHWRFESQREDDQMWAPEGRKCIAAIEQGFHESLKFESSVDQNWHFTCDMWQNYTPNTESAAIMAE